MNNGEMNDRLPKKGPVGDNSPKKTGGTAGRAPERPRRPVRAVRPSRRVEDTVKTVSGGKDVNGQNPVRNETSRRQVHALRPAPTGDKSEQNPPVAEKTDHSKQIPIPDRFAAEMTQIGETAKKYPEEKGRKKRKKDTDDDSEGRRVSEVVKCIAYITFVVVAAILISIFVVMVANDMYAFVKSADPVEVTIPENATLNEVADILHENGIIKYPGIFKMYAKFKKDPCDFHAGEYTITAQLGYKELLGEFKPKTPQGVSWVTIPEGFTTDEIIDLLVETGIGTREKYVEVINNGEFDYWFVDELGNEMWGGDGIWMKIYKDNVEDEKTLNYAVTYDKDKNVQCGNNSGATVEGNIVYSDGKLNVMAKIPLTALGISDKDLSKETKLGVTFMRISGTSEDGCAGCLAYGAFYGAGNKKSHGLKEIGTISLNKPDGNGTMAATRIDTAPNFSAPITSETWGGVAQRISSSEKNCVLYNCNATAEDVTAEMYYVYDEEYFYVGMVSPDSDVAGGNQWWGADGRFYRLDGYLFPDTYEFYNASSEWTVINKMLFRFNTIFTEEYREGAESMGFSVDDIITIASIVEKEAGSPSDFSTVSSVFHNRLNNSAEFPYLETDASIVYAIQHETGKRPKLTEKDMEFDSLYNSYTHPGLPPGPISNPSNSAMLAALNPIQTNYYFFVSSGDKTYFSVTRAEHEAKVAEIRAGLEEEAAPEE